MPSARHKAQQNKACGLEEPVMSHALQRIDETREALMGALAAVWGLEPPGIDAIRSVSFQ